MPYRQLIKPVSSSSTLIYVFFLAVAVGAYALIPLWVEWQIPSANKIPSQFHAALSLVLGWLLVFRTNTAYSRWWEARTLWGALVNASRNMSLKFTCIGNLSPEDRRRANRLIVAFPSALCCHLRDEVAEKLDKDIQAMLGNRQHAPLELARQLYEIVGNARAAGQIDGDDLRVFDAELLRLMDICGACERILKTRIVRSYRVFARQCVILFLATLPWGVVHDFGIWCVPLTFISAYFMLGLETVAEHVEEPFGYDEDDLDLEALCVTIEKSVNEVFESDLSKQL